MPSIKSVFGSFAFEALNLGRAFDYKVSNPLCSSSRGGTASRGKFGAVTDVRARDEISVQSLHSSRNRNRMSRPSGSSPWPNSVQPVTPRPLAARFFILDVICMSLGRQCDNTLRPTHLQLITEAVSKANCQRMSKTQSPAMVI